MDLTPNLRLPFPEDNDPGDGALDLQVLAEAVDAAATVQLASLRSIINKPCRIATLSVTSAGIPSGQDTDIFVGNTWTITYDSSSIATTTTDPFNRIGMGEDPGIYHFGAFLSVQPTGVVNADTLRQLSLTALVPSDRTVFPATTTTHSAFSINYDHNVGAVTIAAELEIYTPFPSVGVSTFAGTTFNAKFFHQNTSSTVQINAGSMAWFWRAADVEAI